MNEQLVKSSLAHAVEWTAGLPADVRGPLAAQVFLLEMGEHAGTNVKSKSRPERSSAVTISPATNSDEWPSTLGEFIAEFGNMIHPYRITAIAAFRFLNDKIDCVSGDDLRAAYSEVRASKPQNLSANIAKCMKRGWLVETNKDGQKAWRVTQRGIEQVRQWRTAAA